MHSSSFRHAQADAYTETLRDHAIEALLPGAGAATALCALLLALLFVM
jgi:hypothetical protein